MEAFAWDLETNSKRTVVFNVPHKRVTKRGTTNLTDPRDIYVCSPPLFIEKGQTFQATSEFVLANTPVIPQVGGANVAVQVGLIFDGYVIRPVQ